MTRNYSLSPDAVESWWPRSRAVREALEMNVDLQRIVDLLALSDPTYFDAEGVEWCVLCDHNLTGVEVGHADMCPWLLARRITGRRPGSTVRGEKDT